MTDSIPETLIKLAAYYEKKLSDEQIEMYSAQLSEHLTELEAALACKKYIDNPGNEFFPRPVSKLIYLVKKPVSNEDMAQNITGLLMEAVRAYGPHWASGHSQNGEMVYAGKDQAYTTWENAALSVFGRVGVVAVQRYGGWLNFCQNVYESPEGVVRAQTKNLLTSLQNIKEQTGSYASLPYHKEQIGPVSDVSNLISIMSNGKGLK